MLLVLLVSFLFATKAFAVCPICTIAVGAGVGVSRWLGIDDAVTGLWVGGLIVSMIIWTLSWFEKKQIKFKGQPLITTVGYYAFTIVPLYFSGVIGNPNNALFCWCRFHLDKLLLGVVVGSCGFYFGATLYSYLKEKNNGHAHFPFEKVVMPISPLILLSIVFYFLTK